MITKIEKHPGGARIWLDKNGVVSDINFTCMPASLGDDFADEILALYDQATFFAPPPGYKPPAPKPRKWFSNGGISTSTWTVM